jgi:quercetin dioxygenase-like cupin family protein
VVQADSSLTGTGTRSVQVLSELITFKVTSEETDGNYTLVETITAPGGGTPPHIQHKDTEAFYVLEGTYTFVLRDEVIEVGPGGHVFVPTETVHAFQNNGAEPARMLIMNAPGGIHQAFFQELGVPVEDPSNPPEIDVQAQIASLMEIAPKYGIELLPPQGE